MHFKNFLKIAILSILTAEVLSFFSYSFPPANKIFFIAIVLAVFILSLRKLEYGLLIVFAELFIGSKGYLFYFEESGFSLSIRVALWLVILSVGCGKIISDWLKNKKVDWQFLKNDFSRYFYLLFLFILLGVWRGLALKNNFDNLFFDLNGWLYFALIIPVYYVYGKKDGIEFKEKFKPIFLVFTAAVIWLCFKTLFLLFVFSHNLNGLAYELYRWLRISGVGEITLISSGFYRIFFQSHIFVLISYLFLLSYFLFSPTKDFLNLAAREKKISTGISGSQSARKLFALTPAGYNLILLTGLGFLMSVNLLTFSRSNWLGLFFGITFLLICQFWRNGLYKAVSALLSIFLSIAIGLVIIFIAVKFPYPKPSAVFYAGLFADRVGQISDEAAASSRWSLLPKLLEKIKINPLLGAGFGATVTYKTSDPRILENNPAGFYTTYAFEWGILDIWLKLGIFGLLSYILLFYIIIFKSLKNANWSNLGLSAGLVSLFFINIFSPYLNHPLGIGYLLIASAAIHYWQK